MSFPPHHCFLPVLIPFFTDLCLPEPFLSLFPHPHSLFEHLRSLNSRHALTLHSSASISNRCWTPRLVLCFPWLVFTSIPVCLVQCPPPSPLCFSSGIPVVGRLQPLPAVTSNCKKTAYLPPRRRVRFIKHLLLTVKRPGYASGNARWQSPRWAADMCESEGWGMQPTCLCSIGHGNSQLVPPLEIKRWDGRREEDAGEGVNKLRVTEGKKRA